MMMFRRGGASRATTAIILAALAVTSLACGGRRAEGPAPEITYTASPVRVKEGEQVTLSWNVPGAKQVWFNGMGRKVPDGELRGDGKGEGADVYAPFPARGKHVVVPSDDAPPPNVEEGRGPVVAVGYVLTATPKDGGAPVSRALKVMVHFYVAPTEALAMQQRGEAVVLDVRDARLFAAGDNIPGAVNMPRDQLESRVGELPADKTIILNYVGGEGGEAEAWGAVWTLAERGRKATVLRGGIEAWWRDVTNAKPAAK